MDNEYIEKMVSQMQFTDEQKSFIRKIIKDVEEEVLTKETYILAILKEIKKLKANQKKILKHVKYIESKMVTKPVYGGGPL